MQTYPLETHQIEEQLIALTFGIHKAFIFYCLDFLIPFYLFKFKQPFPIFVVIPLFQKVQIESIQDNGVSQAGFSFGKSMVTTPIYVHVLRRLYLQCVSFR